MSVYVSVEDKECETLTEVFELNAIFKRFPESGVCLRFVKETSDASFNSLQGPFLLAELEALVPLAVMDSERKELDRLIKLCRRYSANPNVFIRFYGESKGEA